MSDLPRSFPMPDVSVAEVREAMDWFRSLSEAQKLHYRKQISRPDAVSIARYWKTNIRK